MAGCRSDMVKLDKASYGAIFDQYRASESFFPLIGAVLLDEQDGVVYADNFAAPRQVYVEHTFGFAQIIGHSCTAFEADLKRYLLIDKRFAASKVRLYTPLLPSFLQDKKWDSLRSLRQRFSISPSEHINDKIAAIDSGVDIDLCYVDEKTVTEIERVFGVVDRFWRCPRDFINKANAVVARYQGQPASICYAAAEAARRVEIDVLTLPPFRTLGIGKITVMHFVKRCFEQSLQPLWDCFTNNIGSMQLCHSVGFNASYPPYPFYTIHR